MSAVLSNNPAVVSPVAITFGQVRQLREQVVGAQHSLLEAWAPHIKLPGFHESAANLASYVALRRHDLRNIQRSLSCYGLSSLGRCESHVIPTLDAVINGLALMKGHAVAPEQLSCITDAIEQAGGLLAGNTNELFGRPHERSTRFMVTLPPQAADDFEFVRDLILHGMDCARINCAHDDESAWRKMVRNIRRAEKITDKSCRILMDLGGPKLRTGPIAPGPAVLRLRVKRDAAGRMVSPATLILVGKLRFAHRRMPAVDGDHGDIPCVSVAQDWLENLAVGDRIAFQDARGRKRFFCADEQLNDNQWRVTSEQSAYLAALTELTRKPRGKHNKHKPMHTRAREIAALPQILPVANNELILMTRELIPGACRALIDGHAEPVTHFCCLEPRLFSALRVGQRLFIDDGHIGTVVERVDELGAWLRVQETRSGSVKIGVDKGINVLDADLPFGALTEKDLRDLDFVAQHADIVGLSFVRNACDIDRLVQELAVRAGGRLAIVAKIETSEAVRNLPEIIVHGAGRHTFGVMIARGDLAVEIGYARMAEIQEEILWLCEAAHVPVIWATQVLENLVKKGMPSRAEMTDAAMSGRAECVMLNKGPHILQALDALNSVVTRMQAHQSKKTAQLRALHW